MKSEQVRLPAVLEPLATVGRGKIVETLLTHQLVLVLVDLGIGLAAYAGAWLVRLYLAVPFTTSLMRQEQWYVVGHPWLLLIVSQVFLLFIVGLYDDLRLTRYREIIALAFAACVMQVAAVTSLFYFTEQIFPRTVILIFDGFNFVGICLWRGYIKARLSSQVRRTLVVGQLPDSARELLEDISENPFAGMEVTGLVVGKAAADSSLAGSYPVLGTLDQLEEILVDHQIDEVILASTPSWRDEVLNTLTKTQKERNVRIAILPSVYDMVIGKLRHINIHDTPLIDVNRNPNAPFERFVKRSFDVIVASLLLILLLPILVAVSIAVLVFSRGPILYLQQRVGYAGTIFNLIKFRTMVPDAERQTGATLATHNDPRVTAVGKVLRRTRLDELPQLINVLKGDMSFVGPRPERPGFVKNFVRQVPGYADRHKVKPGITGLAQVRGYYQTRAENKLRYDLAYIYNYSFSLDLMILLETIKVIIARRGR